MTYTVSFGVKTMTASDKMDLMKVTAGLAEIKSVAHLAKGWAFDEARRVLKHCQGITPPKGHVLFETGYGPSGRPHLGTFGEVVRTVMVQHAFNCLTGGEIPTQLICFSDDLDGLRKVPENVPNRSLLEANLGQPLSSVPDPYGNAESFGSGNNAKLCAFLDRFEFNYEFISSTACYKTGKFDEMLLKILANYDAIMDIMLPTLGKDRRATYSPFLPISPKTGAVLQTPILDHDAKTGVIVFEDEDGTRITQSVTGGHAKLQWKPDWAMRWCALGVDYEMHGKDLMSSTEAGNAICRALGHEPPVTFSYELFLDSDGHKISKSKGNGLSLEEWFAYGPPESLAYYLYLPPRKARRLYFDVIPKAVDEFLSHSNALSALRAQPEDQDQRLAVLQNPAYMVTSVLPQIKRNQAALPPNTPSYTMLLNLVTAAKTESREVIWGFIRSYAPNLTVETCPQLDALVTLAIHYVRDHITPTLFWRPPEPHETLALLDLRAKLETAPDDLTSESAQQMIFDVGKHHNFDPMRTWFSTLYETLLGQTSGPRMGSFISLYGRDETVTLISQALERAPQEWTH